METLGKDFVAFFGWAADKGRMNPNTAKSLSAAVKAVMNVNSEWESMDMATADADELFQTFVHLQGKEFSSDSLTAYSRRFRQALRLFREYVNDPVHWKYRGHSVATRRAGTEKVQRKRGLSVSADEVQVSTAGSTTPMVDYPFPLRENCIVRLRLPVDLKVADVERLAAHMKTLTKE